MVSREAFARRSLIADDESRKIRRLACVSCTASNSPHSLMTKCSLNPKNQPIVVLPILANPRKTRFRWIHLLPQTAKAVESMNPMPVQAPNRDRK